MKCLKRSVSFLCLLSNLAFAAGGGSAGEGDSHSYYFIVEYSKDFELKAGSEFLQNRTALVSLFKKVSDLAKCLNSSKKESLDSYKEYMEEKAHLIALSLERLKFLQGLADQGMVTLVSVPLEEAEKHNIKTTRREIFRGSLEVRQPAPEANSFAALEEKLRNLELNEEKIQFCKNLQESFLGVLRETYEGVKDLLAKEGKSVNDFDIIPCLQKMQKKVSVVSDLAVFAFQGLLGTVLSFRQISGGLCPSETEFALELYYRLSPSSAEREEEEIPAEGGV